MLAGESFGMLFWAVKCVGGRVIDIMMALFDNDELRNEGIIAPYVNMRISPEDYVMRFAIPV